LSGQKPHHSGHDLAASFSGTRKITVERIEKQRVKVTNPITDHLTDVPVQERSISASRCYEITAAVDKRLVRIQNMFANNLKNIEIFSAEGPVGKQFENTEERGRLIMVAAAADNGKIETYFEGRAAMRVGIGSRMSLIGKKEQRIAARKPS
jgi:hypothetical protein